MINKKNIMSGHKKFETYFKKQKTNFKYNVTRIYPVLLIHGKSGYGSDVRVDAWLSKHKGQGA